MSPSITLAQSSATELKSSVGRQKVSFSVQSATQRRLGSRSVTVPQTAAASTPTAEPSITTQHSRLVPYDDECSDESDTEKQPCPSSTADIISQMVCHNGCEECPTSVVDMSDVVNGHSDSKSEQTLDKLSDSVDLGVNIALSETGQDCAEAVSPLKMPDNAVSSTLPEVNNVEKLGSCLSLGHECNETVVDCTSDMVGNCIAATDNTVTKELVSVVMSAVACTESPITATSISAVCMSEGDVRPSVDDCLGRSVKRSLEDPELEHCSKRRQKNHRSHHSHSSHHKHHSHSRRHHRHRSSSNSNDICSDDDDVEYVWVEKTFGM
jgi:hypothetical protein